MILGVGVDVVAVSAFAAQLADPHSVFAQGTFTAGERAQAAARPGDPTRHLAARYAAKEAFIKAWSGSRWNQPPVLPQVDLREIEVMSDSWGRPALRLHGALRAAVGPDVHVHVSLSHDGDIALAQVVLSGRADGG